MTLNIEAEGVDAPADVSPQKRNKNNMARYSIQARNTAVSIGRITDAAVVLVAFRSAYSHLASARGLPRLPALPSSASLRGKHKSTYTVRSFRNGQAALSAQNWKAETLEQRHRRIVTTAIADVLMIIL